jgi:hypothetical protein
MLIYIFIQEVLPAEILRLKKLENLALNFNPLLMAEKRDQKHVSISSLVEISIRYILATNDIKPLDYVPTYIIQRIQTSASQNNACESCRLPFFNPSVKVIHWRDTLGNTQVPFLYRFCSTSCCNKMFWLLLFFIFLCTYCFLSFDYSLYSIATDLFFFFIY